jgi:hypothetical protein
LTAAAVSWSGRVARATIRPEAAASSSSMSFIMLAQ